MYFYVFCFPFRCRCFFLVCCLFLYHFLLRLRISSLLFASSFFLSFFFHFLPLSRIFAFTFSAPPFTSLLLPFSSISIFLYSPHSKFHSFLSLCFPLSLSSPSSAFLLLLPFSHTSGFSYSKFSPTSPIFPFFHFLSPPFLRSSVFPLPYLHVPLSTSVFLSPPYYSLYSVLFFLYLLFPSFYPPSLTSFTALWPLLPLYPSSLLSPPRVPSPFFFCFFPFTFFLLSPPFHLHSLAPLSSSLFFPSSSPSFFCHTRPLPSFFFHFLSFVHFFSLISQRFPSLHLIPPVDNYLSLILLSSSFLLLMAFLT